LRVSHCEHASRPRERLAGLNRSEWFDEVVLAIHAALEPFAPRPN